MKRGTKRQTWTATELSMLIACFDAGLTAPESALRLPGRRAESITGKWGHLQLPREKRTAALRQRAADKTAKQMDAVRCLKHAAKIRKTGDRQFVEAMLAARAGGHESFALGIVKTPGTNAPGSGARGETFVATVSALSDLG